MLIPLLRRRASAWWVLRELDTQMKHTLLLAVDVKRPFNDYLLANVSPTADMVRNAHGRQLIPCSRSSPGSHSMKLECSKGILRASDYGSCGKPASAKIPVWSWGVINLSMRRVSAATPTALVAF